MFHDDILFLFPNKLLNRFIEFMYALEFVKLITLSVFVAFLTVRSVS